MSTNSRSSTFVRTEAIAGITTFFTMAYIVVVNPAILATPGTGMPFYGVMTATVLLSFIMTLFMGLYAKLPYAVAPGMGINAFFVFTVIFSKKVPWPVALGLVFWAGVLFIIISVTPLRVTIARAIPAGLRTAAAAGIGIFLTFIGLKNAGFIVADPVTFVKLGQLDAKAMLAVFGIGLTVFMLNRKSPFAFLTGIAAVTVLAMLAGYVHAPSQILRRPDFSSVLFKLDILGALKPALFSVIVAILFTDLFDSISTFIGVSHAAGMLDSEGHPKNLREGLIVDAFATLGAALLGTSSGTAFIESSAGIEMGGRTGLTSVFTALCFLPCLFIGPLVEIVPPYATAPVLILVGAFMFRSVAQLSLEKLEDVIPSFLTIILIPLTFSITQGILWGFISHVALYVMAGRRREVQPMMFAIGAVSVGLLALEHGKW